jgi:transposase
MDKHSLQLLLAQGVSVERIAKRFGKDPSTISYWLKRHGLISPYAAKHAAKGALDPQQLEECVQSGITIAEGAEIATEGGRASDARHFRHLDPSTKRLQVSRGIGLSIEALRTRLQNAFCCARIATPKWRVE